ncbi:hypothetical protein GF312_05735, partial [Candidatus Poribacteria bacterium]|nr:hypothetical protein [Candidatus Poribacteria bacterium]
MKRYMILTICFFILIFNINAHAKLKSHNVTVGMYNTYFSKDGNLASPTPDLKEVWQGVEDAEYEACNMTMHYWPRPKDLPKVEFGKNPYAQWWIAYMEEAFNLTNQDGEVRLKVIVGPLYSYYRANRAYAFNQFIRHLCEWEKDSIYAGTLGGWYLSEEPMGSSHNFDTGIHSEMVQKIREIEKSTGMEPHKMYIDVSIGGKYYDKRSLASFTRPADVVMISSNTFLWSTSGKQPVRKPNWDRIHWSTKQLRNVVYKDRDKHKLSRPEIHVVLEARDTAGYGQPTHSEMKWQIHTALSHS